MNQREITDLSDDRVRLIKPIPIEVEAIDGQFNACAPELDEFGLGSTVDEAIADLKVAIIELYFELTAANGQLGIYMTGLLDRLNQHLCPR